MNENECDGKREPRGASIENFARVSGAFAGRSTGCDRVLPVMRKNNVGTAGGARPEGPAERVNAVGRCRVSCRFDDDGRAVANHFGHA